MKWVAANSVHVSSCSVKQTIARYWVCICANWKQELLICVKSNVLLSISLSIFFVVFHRCCSMPNRSLLCFHLSVFPFRVFFLSFFVFCFSLCVDSVFFCARFQCQYETHQSAREHSNLTISIKSKIHTESTIEYRWKASSTTKKNVKKNKRANIRSSIDFI